MGLGEATARGASDCVSCPVSRAHSDLCFRTLDNDCVWHALLRAPGYPPAWRRRIQGRLGVKRKLVSRAGHATVIGGLRRVERAPVRSLRKKMTLGAVNESGWDPATRPRKNALAATTGAGAGPRRRFLRGARRLSARGGRVVPRRRLVCGTWQGSSLRKKAPVAS